MRKEKVQVSIKPNRTNSAKKKILKTKKTFPEDFSEKFIPKKSPLNNKY